MCSFLTLPTGSVVGRVFERMRLRACPSCQVVGRHVDCAGDLGWLNWLL